MCAFNLSKYVNMKYVRYDIDPKDRIMLYKKQDESSGPRDVFWLKRPLFMPLSLTFSKLD